MKPMHSVSAAVLVTVLSLVSGNAFAATTQPAGAAMVSAAKADALPVTNLVDMIGIWSSGDLGYLDKATSVKVFDTKTLYAPADLQKIASAATDKATTLGKFRDAIRGDAALKAWFDHNKIDINRVIAVGDPNGHPEVFLY